MKGFASDIMKMAVDISKIFEVHDVIYLFPPNPEFTFIQMFSSTNSCVQNTCATDTRQEHLYKENSSEIHLTCPVSVVSFQQ